MTTDTDDGRSVVAYDSLDRALTIWGAMFYGQKWTPDQIRELLDNAEEGFNETDGFNVWVSTFGLYNAGSLTGYWVQAECAPTTVPEFMAGMVIRNRPVGKTFLENVGEELHCFDTDNAPIDGEMSPDAARRYASLLADFENETGQSIPLLRAWLSNGNDLDDDTASNFADSFQGIYDSEKDFAYELAEELGAIPQEHSWPASYIDWDAATRDLMMDYWSTYISGEGYAIFRS